MLKYADHLAAAVVKDRRAPYARSRRLPLADLGRVPLLRSVIMVRLHGLALGGISMR